jgi:hypothetical protein
VWTAPDGRAFAVDVRLGKPLDVLGLKDTSLAEVREYEQLLRTTATALYGVPGSPVAACPCCGEDAGRATEALRVFGIAYVRCPSCGHGFVREQPAPEALDRLFAESEDHSSTYTDPDTLEIRMAQVVRPKVDWVLDTFRSQHGRDPASAIDVGAGGGHMVAGFAERSLAAGGYELSASSRRFASAAFGIELDESDFLTAPGDPVDIVTFWGLLEYTRDPGAFVAAARRRLAGDGLLVVEVPRFECVGTAVQAGPGAVVSRHLDPTSHVNCFTDSSLATILLAGGFRPVAAWYFGMDAYEVLVQCALDAGGDELVAALGDRLLSLQPTLDAALACDDIVVAAVPL